MKAFNLRTILVFGFSLLLTSFVYSQNTDLQSIKKASNGLKFRPIGPAVMGGRVADIAVNPQNPSNWYVAVGSGGVWKTTNSGTTWQPVFDNEGSYSIGTVVIDPVNPNTVWVGTGENVSGRHVGWGDGVYKSTNAGKSWQNMGLKDSEHIGKILIDPRDNQTIYVAAEGPLWSSGGERGLYKSEDGGKSWTIALAIDANTGVTDVEFDPSNPDVLYAAAYERRRKTWSLLSGGPNSGIYKSTDKGITWKRISSGLPGGEIGKIGLAVTAANPNLVYATIEAQNGQGFYQSTDKGESWRKMNSYISGGTGPHYYQEIEASPQNPELVVQMDVFMQVTRDGGKTFDYLESGREKHSDNHALWIDPKNDMHLLAGCDGGLYESFDQGITWKFFPNLPIAQFYKIGLDNTEPFYNIVAGAQDLGTLIGPSRTTNVDGVRNQDWYVPLGADGYDATFDPEDPNTVYMEIQGGELYRLDRRTEETISIKPSPAPGDPAERFNWDAPIVVSPHNSKTLYFGSQRLWKSTDRGDSWQSISADLTTNTNRYELQMMDAVPSVNSLYDNGAMSLYATLTTVAESPVKQGLLYTGSDDGLIHFSEDDGATWQKAKALPNVPERSFINDIEASQFNPNVVFVAADAHKQGDFSPYLFVSENNGRSWRSLVGDLPKETIVWSIKQDPVDRKLLFLGTEYGVYFSPNKGVNWIKLQDGAPNIAFRDIELHPRDNDLVGATFGRGIYIIDDYSALRDISATIAANANTVLPVRDAWWYMPSVPMQAAGMPSQGSMSFRTPNPEFGANIDYYIASVASTARAERLAKEKDLSKSGQSIPFPGWEQLKQESKDAAPQALLLIKDEFGQNVRWIETSASEGLHRANWDLRYPSSDPINFATPGFVAPWASDPQGPIVAPGKYSAQLYLLDDGQLTAQGSAQEFMVEAAPNTASGVNFKTVAEFQQKGDELSRKISIENGRMSEAGQKLRYMKAALMNTPKAPTDLFNRIEQLNEELSQLRIALSGDNFQRGYNESTVPGISGRLSTAMGGHSATTQMPTTTQQNNFNLALEGFNRFVQTTSGFYEKIASLEEDLQKAGAPYTPGRKG